MASLSLSPALKGLTPMLANPPGSAWMKKGGLGGLLFFNPVSNTKVTCKAPCAASKPLTPCTRAATVCSLRWILEGGAGSVRGEGDATPCSSHAEGSSGHRSCQESLGQGQSGRGFGSWLGRGGRKTCCVCRTPQGTAACAATGLRELGIESSCRGWCLQRGAGAYRGIEGGWCLETTWGGADECGGGAGACNEGARGLGGCRGAWYLQ